MPQEPALGRGKKANSDEEEGIAGGGERGLWNPTEFKWTHFDVNTANSSGLC